MVDSRLQHLVKLGVLLPQRIHTPHSLSRIPEGNRSSFVWKQMNKKIQNCVKKVLAHHTQDLPLFLGGHHSHFIPFCFTFPLLLLPAAYHSASVYLGFNLCNSCMVPLSILAGSHHNRNNKYSDSCDQYIKPNQRKEFSLKQSTGVFGQQQKANDFCGTIVAIPLLL